MKSKNKTVQKTVQTAMAAAIVAISTLLLSIPTPTGGYLNVGDVVILFFSWVLSPWSAAMAAGIGATVSDVIVGAPLYAPATLLIKAGVAFSARLIFTLPRRKRKDGFHVLFAFLGSAVGESLMVIGYFFYSACFLSYGWSAAASLPADCLQAAISAILAPSLYLLYWKTKKTK